tara:strand:+ start:187 stop:360 length:174 start_codon:yes stop_codon:yes gene_type:complete
MISSTDLIYIAQIDVASDGTFSHSVITSGNQWIDSGEYAVKIFYAQSIAESNFSFIK